MKEIKTYGDLAEEVSLLDFIIYRQFKCNIENNEYINELKELEKLYGYENIEYVRRLKERIYIHQDSFLGFSYGKAKYHETHFIKSNFERALVRLNELKAELDKEIEK